MHKQVRNKSYNSQLERHLKVYYFTSTHLKHKVSLLHLQKALFAYWFFFCSIAWLLRTDARVREQFLCFIASGVACSIQSGINQTYIQSCRLDSPRGLWLGIWEGYESP